MSTARKSWTRRELVHNTAGRCSQKKTDQKENEEPSPVVDKPVPYYEAVEASHSPTGLPTTGCCSLYKTCPPRSGQVAPGDLESLTPRELFELDLEVHDILLVWTVSGGARIEAQTAHLIKIPLGLLTV